MTKQHRVLLANIKQNCTCNVNRNITLHRYLNIIHYKKIFCLMKLIRDFKFITFSYHILHWTEITLICDPVSEVDLITEFDFYPIAWRFHVTVVNGVAWEQRTYTPPDTWSCPTLGLVCVSMFRPNSPKLVLLPDFLSFEHPSVLRFYVVSQPLFNKKEKQLQQCFYIILPFFRYNVLRSNLNQMNDFKHSQIRTIDE